jgi:hypothetical protein
MRRSVRRPCAARDHLGHQFVGVQAALHQGFGHLSGQCADACFRADQQRQNQPGIARHQRTAQRFCIARMCYGHGDGRHVACQGQHIEVTGVLVAQGDFRHGDPWPPDFAGRRFDFGGAVHHFQPFLIGAQAVKDDVMVVVELFTAGNHHFDRVTNAYRPGEMQGLVDVDRAGAGKLGAQHRRDQRTGPHAVGDDFAEHRRMRVFRIDMGRIDIA